MHRKSREVKAEWPCSHSPWSAMALATAEFSLFSPRYSGSPFLSPRFSQRLAARSGGAPSTLA